MDATDTPITFKSTRTTSDVNWHFIYVCKRGFWKRILLLSFFMSVGFAAVIIMDGHFRYFDLFALKQMTPTIFLMLTGFFLFTYVIDYICMAYMHWRMAKKFSNQTTELSFDTHGMLMKHEHGQATQNYDLFQKIYLHKHLIVFQTAYRLFYIIAWRDVPVEEKDRLRQLLGDVKERLKI